MRSPPPPVVKPTREDLQVRVELLANKRRSAKRKAQDPPPDSSLPVGGKAPKLGASILPSPVQELGSHAQVRVRGQALPSLAEVTEVAGA